MVYTLYMYVVVYGIHAHRVSIILDMWCTPHGCCSNLFENDRDDDDDDDDDMSSVFIKN